MADSMVDWTNLVDISPTLDFYGIENVAEFKDVSLETLAPLELSEGPQLNTPLVTPPLDSPTAAPMTTSTATPSSADSEYNEAKIEEFRRLFNQKYDLPNSPSDLPPAVLFAVEQPTLEPPDQKLQLQHQRIDETPQPHQIISTQQQQPLLRDRQQLMFLQVPESASSYAYSTAGSEASYSACPTPLSVGFGASGATGAPPSPAPSFVFSNFGGANPQSTATSSSVIPITVPGIEPFEGEYGFYIDFDSLANGKQTKSKEWTYSPVVKKLFCKPEMAVPLNYRTHKTLPAGAVLRVRVIYRSPEYKQEDVLRCPNHIQTAGANYNNNINVTFFVNIDDPNATYNFPDAFGRHSATTVFKPPERATSFSELRVRFMCSSTCTRPSVHRRALLAIFTLECPSQGGGEEGVLGRQVVELGVISCPGRDRKKAERQYAKERGEVGGDGGGGGWHVGPDGSIPGPGKKRLLTKRGAKDNEGWVPPLGKKVLAKKVKKEPADDEYSAASGSRLPQPPSHATTTSRGGSVETEEEGKEEEEEDDDEEIRHIAVKGKKKYMELKRHKKLLDIKYGVDEEVRRRIVDRTEVAERSAAAATTVAKRRSDVSSPPQQQRPPEQSTSQQQRRPLPKKPRKSPHNSGSSLHEFFGVH